MRKVADFKDAEGHMPRQRSADRDERGLAKRYANLCTDAGQGKLSDDEVSESVRGAAEAEAAAAVAAVAAAAAVAAGAAAGAVAVAVVGAVVEVVAVVAVVAV